MNDFIKHDKFEVKDIPVMKFGRHLRLRGGAKLVVGRNQEENVHLQNIQNDKFYHAKTLGVPGPHALLSSNASQEDKELASQIILTYCKTTPDEVYTLSFDGKEVTSSPLESREALQPYTIM